MKNHHFTKQRRFSCRERMLLIVRHLFALLHDRVFL